MITVMVVVARTDGSFHPFDAQLFVVYDEQDYGSRVAPKVERHVKAALTDPTHRTTGGPQ